MQKQMYSKLKRKGLRIPGCESTNHTVCRGELWECDRCHRKMCWEEGSAKQVDLCDDCWYDVKVLKHKYSIGHVSEWRFNYEAT